MKNSPDWKPDSKSLYILATGRGWSRKDVHKLIEKQYEKKSTKELSYEEFQSTIMTIETFSPEDAE